MSIILRDRRLRPRVVHSLNSYRLQVSSLSVDPLGRICNRWHVPIRNAGTSIGHLSLGEKSQKTLRTQEHPRYRDEEGGGLSALHQHKHLTLSAHGHDEAIQNSSVVIGSFQRQGLEPIIEA